MTDINEVKDLANSFFQNESYTSDGVRSEYNQINLDKIIPIIQKTTTKSLIEAYNLALSRIEDLIDKKINALFYLGKDKKFDLKKYLDIEIPEIYSYMVRIYDIRNALLIANNRNITTLQKRSNINRLFGGFDDIFFLEDEIYKFVPKKNTNDRNVIELVNYIKKRYIKYSEKNVVTKIR